MSPAFPAINRVIKPGPPALRALVWPSPALIFIGGATAASVITLLAYHFHLNLATAAFLHLIIVVLLARHSGFWIASSVSVVAVVSQTYFLVPPFLSFVVADSHNLIALATFGYCALTVSRLSSEATRQTRVAESRRRDTEGLYEVSRLVLLMDRRAEPGPQIAAMIPRVFDCETVAIFDCASATIASAGKPDPGLEERTRAAYLGARDDFEANERIWFRVLRVDNRPVGALALRGGEISQAVANALASLVAVAMERARSFEKESRVEAARQSEQLRTAVLDALAHDVKTPLTAIRAASSGLIEAHILDPLHEELVKLIDDESARLDEITNRLLRLARLDARDVRVNRRPLKVRELIEQTAAPARQRTPDRIIRTRFANEGLVVSGDDQLLSMALSQLIDNALKYSHPDSGMTVSAERKGSDALISVHNFGIPIPEADLERIFDRFYRSRDAQRVSGTGLGLSITRKIALAHGGRVWASSDETLGTTFYLSLPLTEDTAK